MVVYHRIMTKKACAFINLARSYKKNFILNSAEHEISDAYKCKNIKKFSFFSGSDMPRMSFFMLLNFKIPTTVGILIFMSRKNFMLS